MSLRLDKHKHKKIRLEKRISPRRNTSIPGQIAFGGGARINCVIRNVSDGGAKLELAGVGNVPALFELHVSGHEPQTCSVSWRSIRELGIAFKH